MSAISISAPSANAHIGKNGSNQADIAIQGLYTFASACHVEARFGSGAFTRIATLGSGTGASWSGTLTGQAAGPRNTLTVRFEEDTATSASVSMGIGPMLLYLGDSTVRDYYTNTGTYVNTSIGVSQKTSNLNDADWLDGNSAADKSPCLRIADLLAAQLNQAVGYHVEAHAGTELGHGAGSGWDPTDVSPTSSSGDFLYNLKFRLMANSRVLRVHAIFVDLGTNSIEGFTYTQTQYRDLCTEFAAWLNANITGAPNVYFHICGEAGTTYTYYDSTRGAIFDAVALGVPSRLGAVIYDQEYHTTGGENDFTHPHTDAHKLESGNRHFLAAKGDLTGGAQVRGPRVSSITHTGSTVVVTFDQDLGQAVSTSLTAAAWQVKANGATQTVSSVTVVGPRRVNVVCSAPLSGTIVASYARADTAAGVTIPTGVALTLPDSSTQAQPAEPFYDVSSTVSSASASVSLSPSASVSPSPSPSQSPSASVSPSSSVSRSPSPSASVSPSSSRSPSVSPSASTSPSSSNSPSPSFGNSSSLSPSPSASRSPSSSTSPSISPSVSSSTSPSQSPSVSASLSPSSSPSPSPALPAATPDVTVIC